MKRQFIATTLASLLISGCATSRSPVTSDTGAGQSDGKLASMASNALGRDGADSARERADLMQKLQEMGSELADLRGKLQAKPGAVQNGATQDQPTSITISMVPPAAAVTVARGKNGKAVARPAASPTPPSASRESIVIRETGMVFRVMHPFAKTDFNPTKPLKQQLLQAARAGKNIDIRGRTDAPSANEADREIAMQRALNARVFLANNGIHPRKMRINYMAAGDNVADNSTAEGRARNRRVEIETTGISPDILEDMAAVIRQDLQ